MWRSRPSGFKGDTQSIALSLTRQYFPSISERAGYPSAILATRSREGEIGKQRGPLVENIEREIAEGRVLVLRDPTPEEPMSDLDRMLAAWSARTVPADLSQIEPHVWARLKVRERPLASGALGFRAALVACVMIIGVIVGGTVGATAESEASPFATHAAYAPSTLLDGRK